MEKEIVQRLHILVIPLPFQGHINPMLQFAERLVSKGLKVTFIVAFSDDKAEMEIRSGSIKFEPISNTIKGNKGLENLLEWFKDSVPKRLPEIIAGQDLSVDCVVYDSGTPWVLDLAKGLGIRGASFFTHSCAVACIYYNANKGLLRIPVDGPRVSLPGLPVLEPCDLPSFVSDPESYPSILKLVISRFSNVSEADWIFFSSFDSLEFKVVNWMRSLWPIKTIGPTILSKFLDNKRLDQDKDHGSDTCTKWLDLKEVGSVVYVSFGTLANVGKEQMEELAEGLKRSGFSFLWVLRDTEMGKLPREFLEESSEKWLIVDWCVQVEVLCHKSVGCFVTHCGWNSTLEAVSLGVPMVAVPQWTDQMTNAKFVADVWNVGVRVRVVRREEIERCVREVMSGERGREYRENAMRWNELAKEALSEGGSCDRNIHEFVAELVAKTSC